GEAKAASVWINERVVSEADDPAIAIAWRGALASLDEPFGTLARTWPTVRPPAFRPHLLADPVKLRVSAH
ncbi:hypothetical protein G3N96_26030, partial [Burkholderia sp. Se-20373]|uniref:hypothetical protein n=1 Tax=Burkholderia sp. Se-20373 TaxID=2703898 RepID=UPI00198214A0